MSGSGRKKPRGSARKSADRSAGRKSPTAIVEESVGGPFDGLLIPFLVALLEGLRFVVPTESAPRGDTLWIAQLWFAAALIVSVLQLRADVRPASLDWLDASVWCLVLGHVVSGGVVYFGEGNRRLAMNMMWEWLSLGISFHLLRRMVGDAARARALAVSLVSLAIVLSGLGFWQHFVFYKQNSQSYAQDRAELDELIAREPASLTVTQQRRIQQLVREFQQNQIPLEGQSRQLFENRLQASSEPFGPFALANTFGGLLACVLCLQLLGLFASADSWKSRLFQLALMIPTGWCLLLTKSRTAWLGCLAGCLYGAWLLRSRGKTQRATQYFVIVAVFASIGLGFVIGGLDREVISESPKSIQYRLQYWSASLQMLSERPLFGAGPGNFRPHYLRHKLPESSEEIADPHNLFLDAWSSGGLIGLAGLMAFCILIALPRSNAIPADAEQQQPSDWHAAIPIGCAAAFAFAWCYESFIGEFPDERNWVLMAAFIVCVGIVRRILIHRFDSRIFQAATLALIIHLIGAGGMEMPAVVQCLLILAALFRPKVDFPLSDGTGNFDNLRRIAPVVCSGLLCFTAFQFGLIPVLTSRLNLRLSEFHASEGRFSPAMQAATRATQDDQHNPLGPNMMAELFQARWQQTRTRTDFAAAMKAYTQAAELDPVNAQRYRGPGLLYLSRFEAGGDSKDAQRAAEWLRKRVERYPTDPTGWLEYHRACVSAKRKEDAKNSGETALRLDDINREHGHTDRYLPDAARQQIQANLRTLSSEPGSIRTLDER